MNKSKINQLAQEVAQDLHATTSPIDAAFHSGRLLVLESLREDEQSDGYQDWAELEAFLDGIEEALNEVGGDKKGI